mgnify:CR=1 FL=1
MAWMPGVGTCVLMRALRWAIGDTAKPLDDTRITDFRITERRAATSGRAILQRSRDAKMPPTTRFLDQTPLVHLLASIVDCPAKIS